MNQPRPDDPYVPGALGNFVLGTLGFTAGAALSWFAFVRPLFRWVTGTH